MTRLEELIAEIEEQHPEPEFWEVCKAGVALAFALDRFNETVRAYGKAKRS